MKKKILSLILCLVLIVGLLPIFVLPVRAATTSQNNIVARADYLYGITWTCKKTVYGWRNNYVFNSGSTYRIPYGQPVSSGSYIGFGVSVDTFLSATKSASSVFYSSRSTYGSTSSVYYAMDCSAFVSWCWGISRKTTASIPQVSTNLGKATSSNISKLQLGDALNSSSVGHVVLVTGLTYSGSSIKQIEITEQTPPQLKRSYYTPSSLASKYGSSYYIQRYTGSVPVAPGGSSSSGSSSGSTTASKYYPACASSQTSIVSALNNIGVDSSKEYRTKIAAANGISNYSGTEDQNVALLELMKAGKLMNPDYKESVYFPATSAGSTLIEALDAIGVDSSKEYRTKIAAANNISNYTGTYDQNITMLELLRAGKLVNPDGASSSGSSGSTQNGYDRGYKGGMAGDGKIYAHGLDVSAWQEEDLDFKAIKNAGYSYVILRAGTGKGKDTCFETYYTNARAAGLNIGAYYYSYATTVAGAQSDASNMLTWINGKTFEYPIYFDYEDPSQDSLSSTTAKNICLAFCDAMANAGYLAGVYTGYARSTNLPMSEICAKYEVWIARYIDYTYETLSPTYSSQYGMYQYTDRNYIGNLGPYDGDVSFKDYPAIVKQYGFNGYAGTSNVDYLSMCTSYPTYCKVVTTKTTPLNSLPCSIESSYGSKTLLTESANKTYVAKKLIKNAAGNFWYQITLETGETAYLYNAHAKYVESVDTDLSINGEVVPGKLYHGEQFEFSGMVSTVYNRLDSVQVTICDDQGTDIISAPVESVDDLCDLADITLNFASLANGSYCYKVSAIYSGLYAVSDQESETYRVKVTLLDVDFTVSDCEHNFITTVVQGESCMEAGVVEMTCTICNETSRAAVEALGHDYVETLQKEPTCISAGMKSFNCSRCDHTIAEPVSALGHSYDAVVTAPTCLTGGYTTYTCYCGETYVADYTGIGDHSYKMVTIQPTCTVNGSMDAVCTICGVTQSGVIPATGHNFYNGSCTVCGAADPSVTPSVTKPTLTLKVPSLEFKDMICITAFYTAENIQDVVEMGMITYSTKVSSWSVDTAEHVIPGATYVENSGRYYSGSQGIHAKYLGDTMYLAVYAKLSDGTYAYSKLAGYSAVQYATNQLKNSTDTKLKQLCAAMLNYGAEAQLYFGHNTGALANAGLTSDQKALSETYRADMITAVPSASTTKQGIFVNNSGFASRKPAISFEGAFCINYFFTPKYAPASGITMYYWSAEDFNANSVLTAANATGKFKLEGSSEYRGDITGISAKALSEAVYVACAYKDSNGNVWTSGVLGYSIGSYCSSQASKGNTISNLAMATAVYGYHAKAYFG